MESIFTKGADLWVLPDIENSLWRWELEWSVNFQIAKSLKHPSPKLPGPAVEMFKEWEALDYAELEKPSSPWTLIAVENLLPAKWLIYSREIEKADLTRELDKMWNGLGRPQTRFFPSKTWTSRAIQGLKSECVRAESTEVVTAKES